MEELDFEITAPMWIYQGKGAWHFITIDGEEAAKVRFFTDPANTGRKRRGWGSVKVTATIGNTTWETSMFPSKDLEGYVLPIKKDVRKAEGIFAENDVTVRLKVKTGL
ncbi:DUF1905 domain-containing protein [Pseudemcibacter aquimaris]|uniref:DUF1905 domain-containing protein n=1 Tax=Pseudemcibacter aquimaris TaxID=2857064 RepID=UPI00201155AB|nr:DUF1905 domain-containing protein [Pseudemcibacter aquimaris]MCC3862044.1 DUF1905 domain-containing protein [Pseudemcibacter aquimaris]WDU58796.1 DUF1905 domain-containing protein [Pseudemcibacter aquimaris]